MRRRTFWGWGVGRKWNCTNRVLIESGNPKGEPRHRKDAFPENDDVHVQWLEVRRTVRVLIETPETDEIVCPEEFDLLARFFHLDVFRCEWVNAKNLFKNGWLNESLR